MSTTEIPIDRYVDCVDVVLVEPCVCESYDFQIETDGLLPKDNKETKCNQHVNTVDVEEKNRNSFVNDVENEALIERSSCSETDPGIPVTTIATRADDTSSVSPIEETKPTRKARNEIITDNQALNMFLNELYERKVNIRRQFSDQESYDIRTAVGQQVDRLAKTIGEIDPRLKWQEVIPVGSARERTQIVRPCEYDYILVMQALSKPGAVSVSPIDRKNNNCLYKSVKLETYELRSLFHKHSRGDHIIASSWLPFFRRGLKELFYATVARAVTECSSILVKKQTGCLAFKRVKPESHGPACMVMLEWHGKLTGTCINISADLCPALQLHWKKYKDILESADCDVSENLHHIQSIGSVLLMPNEGMMFKVTFTQAELLLTEDLSEHHITCYKLLKYMLNGEPLPIQMNTSKVKRIFKDTTIISSYTLKMIIWNHQLIQHCFEEEDLGLCVFQMLSELEECWQLKSGLRHPFNINSAVKVASDWPDEDRLATDGTFVTRIRIRTLFSGFKRMQKMSVDKYNFVIFCRLTAISGMHKYINGFNWNLMRLLYHLITLLSFVLFVYGITLVGIHACETRALTKIFLWSIGSTLMISSMSYMNFFHGKSKIERYLLIRFTGTCINILILCINYFSYFLGLTFIALSARLPNEMLIYFIFVLVGIFMMCTSLTEKLTKILMGRNN